MQATASISTIEEQIETVQVVPGVDETREPQEIAMAQEALEAQETPETQVKPAGVWQRLRTRVRQWLEEPGDDGNGDGNHRGDDDELDGELTLRRLTPSPLHFGYDGAETFLAGMLEEAVSYADEVSARQR